MPSTRQTQMFFSWTSEPPGFTGFRLKKAPSSYLVQTSCTFGIEYPCPVAPHSFSTMTINTVCLISTVRETEAFTLRQGQFPLQPMFQWVAEPGLGLLTFVMTIT